MATKSPELNRSNRSRRKKRRGYLRSGRPRVSGSLRVENGEFADENLPMFGVQIRHTINVFRQAIKNAREARRKKAVLEKTEG